MQITVSWADLGDKYVCGAARRHCRETQWSYRVWICVRKMQIYLEKYWHYS